MSSTATFLTQVAYDKLQAELAQLETVDVPDVVRRIDIARSEGDLKENGGYHAAREEHAKMDGRIRQLQSLLRDAVVGSAVDEAQFDGTAGPGTLVTVRFAGAQEVETFLIGSREGVSDELTVYSPESPIGDGVSGHRAGDTATYTTPTGKTVSVAIIAVDVFSG
jgi:transcription elongation factor GreA